MLLQGQFQTTQKAISKLHAGIATVGRRSAAQFAASLSLLTTMSKSTISTFELFALFPDVETALRKRLYTHKIRISYGVGYVTAWGWFRSVTIKVRFGTRYGDWAMREARLINRLQPPLNCVGSIKKRGAA